MSSGYRYDEKPTSKVIGIKPVQINVHKSVEDNDNDASEQLLSIEKELNDALTQLEQTKLETTKLVNAAKEQIDKEKQIWETEKKQLIEDAQLSGYQDGFDSGSKESMDQYKQLVDHAKTIVDEAKTDYLRTIDQSEEEILKIGINVASKIIHTVIDEGDEFINIVRDVLKEVKEQASINIFSHPEDYQIILNHKQELLNIISSKAVLSIYPDSDLEKGSCIVETPFGKIDASVQSQLLELRNKLFHITEEFEREY
ncbi:flagellar assembly protein FliH [Aquibacillus rhizosphaerae]|uniref:Flagellar assembly protein FliH n=1 Tax=Aquibacillus rhizosphaerae TaxID=3051431 RepID=A0ABT7L2H3_9BACI|nr:flagellar assembly protein FliH [Aquibacillus sp. LR5S19]MDL4840061.1 flagellar assembly protein FliH [Aquibacillus sp. LR5S19]